MKDIDAAGRKDRKDILEWAAAKGYRIRPYGRLPRFLVVEYYEEKKAAK